MIRCLACCGCGQSSSSSSSSNTMQNEGTSLLQKHGPSSITKMSGQSSPPKRGLSGSYSSLKTNTINVKEYHQQITHTASPYQRKGGGSSSSSSSTKTNHQMPVYSHDNESKYRRPYHRSLNKRRKTMTRAMIHHGTISPHQSSSYSSAAALSSSSSSSSSSTDTLSSNLTQTDMFTNTFDEFITDSRTCLDLYEVMCHVNLVLQCIKKNETLFNLYGQRRANKLWEHVSNRYSFLTRTKLQKKQQSVVVPSSSMPSLTALLDGSNTPNNERTQSDDKKKCASLMVLGLSRQEYLLFFTDLFRPFKERETRMCIDHIWANSMRALPQGSASPPMKRGSPPSSMFAMNQNPMASQKGPFSSSSNVYRSSLIIRPAGGGTTQKIHRSHSVTQIPVVPLSLARH